MAKEKPSLIDLDLFGEADDHEAESEPGHERTRRANGLDGATWTRYSISVWSDIKKSPAELATGHPAMFPSMLVERLIDCFTAKDDQYVLDPFMGSGASLVAALNRGKVGVGFDISPDFVEVARNRLRQLGLFHAGRDPRIIHDDARNLVRYLEPDSMDLCVTSPPYWDILSQKRTADYKPIRDYGEAVKDLAKISDYEVFLSELAGVFSTVLTVLKPGKYCVVNVMDLRKKSRFYPFHSDLAARLEQAGWIFDDTIIWDRRQEYNNLRPLGFPSVFRINKVHEYLLIFKKPPAR